MSPSKFSGKLIILALATPVFLEGCSVSSGGPEREPGESADYTQQNLQGLINGEGWSFVTGRVSFDEDASRHSFDLISSKDENICREWALEPEDGAIVMFGISDSDLKKQRIELDLSKQTLTLSKHVDGEYLNNVASDGFIEFTGIDTGSVSGKIAATHDDQNKLSGDFEVVRCCKDPETGRNAVCGTSGDSTASESKKTI
ncbi:MAG: hypothetical protein AB7T49_02885 [Oligoflexales bacterium]